MRKIKSYFECKRCFNKFYQLIDIQRHLNKKKKCIRNIESFKYKDEDLEKVSLERIYIKEESNKNICELCNKQYSTPRTLNFHKLNNCKFNNEKIDNEKNDIPKKDKNTPKIINNNISNTIYNNCNNITINNNININFSIAKDFNEEWDSTKINDNLKLILLLSNSKFTNTLENILENEVNLNVLIDNTSESGLVYTNNSLKKMDIKDIVNKSMDKIYNQLCEFHNDLIEPNRFDLNKDILSGELNTVKNKYEKYKKDIEMREKVNKLITNIYNKKKDETISELKSTIILSDGY